MSRNSKIRPLRILFDIGIGLAILCAVLILSIFIGNKYFGVPQIPITMEVPYKLDAQELSNLVTSNVLPVGTNLDDNALTLAVKFDEFGSLSWLVIFVFVLYISLIAIGFYLVRSVLVDSEKGATFTDINSNRFLWMGHLSVIYFILESFVLWNILKYVESALRNTGNYTVGFYLSVVPFVMAMIFYVLAIIWKDGVQMQNEIDLTI